MNRRYMGRPFAMIGARSSQPLRWPSPFTQRVHSQLANVCITKKSRQLLNRGFHRNSSLQAAWDTSIARTAGFL